MKINDLEFYLVEISRTESRDPVRSLLVRLATDSGREGWGESTLGVAAGRTGRPPRGLAAGAGRAERVRHRRTPVAGSAQGARSLRCAVEMACWDLIGRAVGQPLCNLLGGRYRRACRWRSACASRQPQRAAEVARALAEQGFYTQVVTASGRPDEDLQTLRRSAQPPASGRNCTSTAGRATTWTPPATCARKWSPTARSSSSIRWPPATCFAVAALGRQTSVPLAVWRAIRAPADVLAAVRCGAARWW